MILAENLETLFPPRPLPPCSPCSFVRAACPACPEPLGDSVAVLNSFSPLSAPPTRHSVYKIVTPNSQNVVFCPFCFQSLAHSFAASFSTTPLQSVRSALFAGNTGGGYTPQSSPHVFKGLRTLAPNGVREGFTLLAPSFSGRFDPAEGCFPLHQSRITSHQPPITRLGVYCLFSLRTEQ
jgi:hypothetical protein